MLGLRSSSLCLPPGGHNIVIVIIWPNYLPVDHSIVTFSFNLSKVREKVALGENFFYDNDSESMND